MSVDFSKNKDGILRCFNDVLDEKTDTDWVLFGYEGQSNVLKVVSFGDDGLDGLVEDLNESKIMYAVVRVIDPKTTRQKIVLINWQGEGAPNLRKGMCARHLPDVKRLLKGVHISVNARTEDEVESNVIMSAVMKASATEYNFRERSEMPERNEPVGTNYHRTNPLVELSSNSRNKFWEEQEAEERKRKEEELKKVEEEAKNLERLRRLQEERDAKAREQINRERNARISAERKAEMEAAQNAAHVSTSNSSQQWQQDVVEQQTEENERIRRADRMRQERKKEAESLIGKKMHETRSIFEAQCNVQDFNSKNTRSRPPPKKICDFTQVLPNNDSNINKTNHEESVLPKRLGMQWPPKTEEQTMPKIETGRNINSKVTDSYISNIQVEKEVKSSPPQYQAFVENNYHRTNSPTTTTNIQVEEPPIENAEIKVENSTINNTYPDPTVTNGVEHTVEYITQGEDINNDDISMSYEVDGIEYQILPEHGLCARALYDYQAADETEITFDPGDIITGIDQIDVGWWQGVSPMGIYGLFPANYVELINGTRIH